MTRFAATLNVFAVLISLAAAGCKSDRVVDGTGEACGPLRILVDGKPIAPLGFGKAVQSQSANGESLTVHVFGDDSVTCDALLSHGGRQRGTAERTVRAMTGPGPLSGGVGIDTDTKTGLSVTRTSRAPTTIGEPVTLCIAPTEFRPMSGRYQDQRVELRGSIVGAFCGVWKFGR